MANRGRHNLNTAFQWLTPPPGGYYGHGFDPERAGQLLNKQEVATLTNWGRPFPGFPGREAAEERMLREYPSFGIFESCNRL